MDFAWISQPDHLLASTCNFLTYYTDQIGTKYQFSIRFQSPKAWNIIDDKFLANSFQNTITKTCICTGAAASIHNKNYLLEFIQK